MRPAGERHHLPDADLEPAALDAERLHPGQEARHLALVVGAPHVDDAVEPAHQELVAVVRDVAGEVRVVAALVGGLAQHALLAGIAERARVEPERAVLLPHEALLREQRDRLADRLAVLDRRLAEPLVVVDVDRLHLVLDEPQDARRRPAAGLLDVVGAVVRGRPGP